MSSHPKSNKILGIGVNLEAIEKPLRPEQMKWNLHVKFGNPEAHVKVVLEMSGVIQNSEAEKRSLLNGESFRVGKLRPYSLR
jgi:hypothetical protein